MRQVRFVFLLVTTLGMATALLDADEKPAAEQPLEVLESCLHAAEAGDFDLYVEHLSEEEQTLQAGYILVLSRFMSRTNSYGTSLNDPEMFLLTRTMSDLVKTHTVTEGDREAQQQAAAKTLGELSGEFPRAYRSGPVRPHSLTSVALNRAQYIRVVAVLKDSRRFLVAALAETARPTDISGENVAPRDSAFSVEKAVMMAQELKWTLYTRGDYAVAIAPQPKPEPKPQQPMPVPPGIQYPYYHVVPAAHPRPHIEFQRIDGQWKITQLLPVLLTGLGLDRIANGNSLASGTGGAVQFFAAPATPSPQAGYVVPIR